MTEGELKLVRKAITDLETGMHFNAPKSFLRIMSWQAKETLTELLERQHDDNLDIAGFEPNNT
jgi:hypothetical protein